MALAELAGSFLAGRGVSYLAFLFFFFLAWVHYVIAVRSLLAPAYLATLSGEGRAGCTSSADPGRELARDPDARKGPAKHPPQPCAAAPRDGGAPQGPAPLPGEIVPRPSLHKVTLRLGAGQGPVLAWAPRAESGAAVVGRRTVGKKEPWGPTRGFQFLPGQPKVSFIFSCAFTDTDPLGHPTPAQYQAQDAGEEQFLQYVCLEGVVIDWAPPAPPAAASVHHGR